MIVQGIDAEWGHKESNAYKWEPLPETILLRHGRGAHPRRKSYHHGRTPMSI